ncbi:hypothetical protein AB6A40_009683 [Gnathostoma spinigerum]|uniref:Uncharacterized protein n=1 Tax=Gnathostoma spinigerum TaxID=75299 RepID=A0ABD6EXU3_9BILA
MHNNLKLLDGFSIEYFFLGVDQSPLMTWGEIEGTPFRLDASDLATGGSDHPPSFKIPAIPVREKLLHGMNDTIAKRYRERRKKALKQAEQNHVRSPRFGSIASAERLLSMSPAAHRLATKELGIRLGTDKALKASYERATTRTPDSVPRLSTTPSSTKILRSSPCIEKSKRPSTPLASSITDNLLNFGGLGNPSEGRPSAADFF